MDKFPDGVSGLHSPDDFDLLSLGILPQEEEPEPPADDEEPFTTWTAWSSCSGWSRRQPGNWNAEAKKTPWKSRKRPKSPEIQHPAAPKGAAGCFSLCARQVTASAQTGPGWH